jgi:Holliday junction resolvase-like predicted endonuclease
VKTRSGSRHGGGFEAVDARKRRKLRALAEVFLLTHGAGASSVRFDVASVAVLGGASRGGDARVELFEDAF